VHQTTSYANVVPAAVRDRYDWFETRNAAAVLRATNPGEWADLIKVLQDFKVDPGLYIVKPGGNESDAAATLNEGFRKVGWREGKYTVEVSTSLTRLPYHAVGETTPDVVESSVAPATYLIDNLKGRVATDVEWHAKDGNLDRDLAAYRSLHDAGIIDGAAMVTMNRADMVKWAREIDPASKKFSTSTTTNLEKVIPRLQRGDGGGCPVLVAAISRRTV
jgi:hypothetical protein